MAEPEKSFTDYLKSYIGFDNKPETKIKQTNQLNIFEIPLGSTLGDANLNLESFTLPMSASGSDQKISEDDAGHPVFRSKLDGSTYTIMYKKDQRTDLTKFKEDVIPAVKEYVDNPYLPTKEQVVDTTKAVAGSIYDTFSIPGDIASGKKSLSNVTYGDVYEIAGGSALATTPFKVPGGDSSNTLRLFGGVGMVGTGTSKNYKKAKKLLKKYYKNQEFPDENPNQGDIDFKANKEIWEQTNWYVDPIDGQWRFYIDDSKSKLNSIEDVFKNNEITQSEIKGSEFKSKDGLETRLGDIFDHPELYKKYPNFRNLPVQFYDNPLSDNLGTASDGYVGINLANQKDVKSIRSTILHEIQHVIQRREDFVRGSSDENIPVDLTDKKQVKLDLEQKSFEIERDRLVNELNATSNSLKKILLENKKPIKGLTADQEVEIYKLKPIDTKTNRAGGPTWTSIGKDYGVSPGQIQKAWDRQNLANNLRVEKNKLNKSIFKLQNKILDLSEKSLRVDFEFYRGAGGEIESRLVQKMAKNTSGTTKFPLETRAEMLKEEGDKFEYRGKFGVDPLVYEIKPRREPNRETFLNRLRRESITRKRQKGRGYKYFEGGSVSTKTTAPVDTGNKTISGRTIWNDPETGEDYSERSTTFEIDGKYYTMPTVSEDGRQYSEDQIRNYVKENGPVDYITGEKLPEFRSMEDALEYAISRSSTRKKPAAGMSEGGSVNNMDNQMKVFEEGGIADDGMNRDPISGNEVPSGSLASEVRDDIPAQLSEGEYVVPADVVRFFGVKFFEDLRMEAKMGLQQMEQDGRIGGEPIDTPAVSSNTDDLSPEEQKLLQEIMAMEQPEEQSAGFAPGGYAGTLDSSSTGSDYAIPKGFKSFADYVVSPTKVEDQFKTLGGSYLETGSTGMADSVAPVEPVVNKVCPPGQIFSEKSQMCIISPGAYKDNSDDGGGIGGKANLPEPEDWGVDVDWTNSEGMLGYVSSVLTPMDPTLEKGLQIGGALTGGFLGFGVAALPLADAMNDLSNARATSLIARAMGDDKTADAIDAQIDVYAKKAPKIATSWLGNWLSSGTSRAGYLARKAGFDSLEDAAANPDAFRKALVGTTTTTKIDKSAGLTLLQSKQRIESQPLQDQINIIKSSDKGDERYEKALKEATKIAAEKKKITDDKEDKIQESIDSGSIKKGLAPTRNQRGEFGMKKGGLIARPKKKTKKK